MKKPKPSPEYQQLIDKYTPKKRIVPHCFIAFCSGGALCALAQLGKYCLMRYGNMMEDDASAIVIIAVIAAVALLTGLGIYDRLGQRLGAGLAVPISGFANSIASAMLEHKCEGYVLGSGCNSFKLAGAIIIFGIGSAFAASLPLLLVSLFR